MSTDVSSSPPLRLQLFEFGMLNTNKIELVES